MKSNNEIELQRDYYARTASIYDELHVQNGDEHFMALSWLAALIGHYKITSVLDVGSGTGRGLIYLKKMCPELKVVGIEQSCEQIKIGYKKVLTELDLFDGDALNIALENNSFDLVCEFGVLHHVKKPQVMIGEMLRVSKFGIFISDDNHFACGSSVNQITKRFLRSIHAWKLAYWLRTGGKCYGISEGDGLSYAYSVFDDYDFIAKHCQSINMMNTNGKGDSLFRSAQNVALFGRKEP